MGTTIPNRSAGQPFCAPLETLAPHFPPFRVCERLAATVPRGATARSGATGACAAFLLARARMVRCGALTRLATLARAVEVAAGADAAVRSALAHGFASARALFVTAALIPAALLGAGSAVLCVAFPHNVLQAEKGFKRCRNIFCGAQSPDSTLSGVWRRKSWGGCHVDLYPQSKQAPVIVG